MKWFHDRADRDQFCEEVEILEAEFQRPVISFGWMSEVWSQMATDDMGLGSAAYGYRKAAMYKGLEEECKQAYTNTCRIASHLSD